MADTSPFKLLDAYGKQDKDIFFGREEEVERLYEMVFQTNLSLIYGPSGSGKTSLINCGLANRFRSTDWFDIYIRRGDDLNAALLRSLKQFDLRPPDKRALKERLARRRPNKPGGSATDEAPPPANEAVRILREIHKQFLKPVYLLFDQFEELFILGREAERAAFYRTIADILATEDYCRVLIVLREEYLADLDNFEKVVPNLFAKRLRVEPMSRQQTNQVIVGTTEKFSIQLADEVTPNAIIDALTKDQQRVELTYLQVFLDKLYHRAARGNGKEVVFDQQLVAQVGAIEDVLGDFLDTQSSEIQTALQREYPASPPRSVGKLLNAFVTLEGTRQPLAEADLRIPGLEASALSFCLDQLEKARLLHRQEGRFELAHDALAQRIAAERTAEEVALLQVAKIVRDRRQAFPTTRTYLNHNELQLLASFRETLEAEERLSPEEWRFVKKSMREENRRRRWRIGMVMAAMIVLAGFAIVFFTQRNYAREQTRVAEAALLKAEEEERAKNQANYTNFLNLGKNAIHDSEYEQAEQALLTALAFDSTGAEAKALLDTARTRLPDQARFERLLAAADALFIEEQYLEARDSLQAALSMNFNNDLVISKQAKVEEKLAGRFEILKQAGDAAFDAGEAAGDIESFRLARANYEEARRSRPNDPAIPDIIEMIALCEARIKNLQNE